MYDDLNQHKYASHLKEFQESAQTIIANAISRKSRVKPIPIDIEICRVILRLGPDPNPSDVEDVLYYLMDAYQFCGHTVGYDEINIDTVILILLKS
jgi:hypothetical protein